jgi:ubiquinone/menaquinone biosynthesis C-methylase UbiE
MFYEAAVDSTLASGADANSNYYGKVLKTSADLKTDACCTAEAPSGDIKKALSNISSSVNEKYYGCGLISPDCLKGMRVLDIGCGAGRDVYLLSQLVGPDGFVTGLDITPEQLDVARSSIEWHMSRFQFDTVNVSFIDAAMEDLSVLEDDSFDIIVSNCVINLSSNKRNVFQHAYRVLKPGGEMYFSDVYSSKRLPNDLKRDETLWGECLSGALYWNDFLRLAKEVGFNDPRLLKSNPIAIRNKSLQERCGTTTFYSATYRLFKIIDLEYDCEDYGQAVIYKGTVPGSPNTFTLDDHHVIEKGKVFPVCGNTYRMLNDTRFKAHFDFIGSWEVHYGIFDGCGKIMPFADSSKTSVSSCC